MQDIRVILKNRREELSLTQQDVANAVGVSEATVSRWESGDIGDLKRSRIAALAKVVVFDSGGYDIWFCVPLDASPRNQLYAKWCVHKK